MSDVERLNAQVISATPVIPTLDNFLTFIRINNLARQERFFVNFTPPQPTISTYINNLRDLTLMCEQAALPGKTLNTKTLRINGLDERRAHTLDYMGDSITLQFLVDTNFIAKNVLEHWMGQCVSPATEGREVGFYTDYIGKISLHVVAPAGIPGEALFNWSPTQADGGLRQLENSLRQKNPTLGVLANKAINLGKQKIDRTLARAKSQISSGISPTVLEAFRDIEKVIYTVELFDCFPKAINVVPLGNDAIGVQRLTVTFAYKYWVSSTQTDDTIDKKIVNSANKLIGNTIKKGLQNTNLLSR
jgi:hypothetical protein